MASPYTECYICSFHKMFKLSFCFILKIVFFSFIYIYLKQKLKIKN